MGTRSLTILYDEKNTEIAVIYRQYDGYPDGHGAELADFLVKAKHNGMNCLAANIVRHIKTYASDGVSNGYAFTTYLYPAGTRNMGEEYIYKVYMNHANKLIMEIEDPDDHYCKWKGTPEDFLNNYLPEYTEEED